MIHLSSKTVGNGGIVQTGCGKSKMAASYLIAYTLWLIHKTLLSCSPLNIALCTLV